MRVYFLDTSVFLRAYMEDEAGHDEAVQLLTSGEQLIGSELLRVEAASAMRGAQRGGRAPADVALEILSEMESDTGAAGVVELIDFDGPRTLARALALVLDHPIRALDAVHVAVADLEGRRLADDDAELVFATHDDRQREVARAIGLAVL
jgi:predicted nucleic acid-binding protein